MAYIFIDESGDLGMKGSKYFIMAAVLVKNPKKLDKLVKRTRNNYKREIGQSNEIKGSITLSKVKKSILKKLNKMDCQVFIIIFNKKYKYKLDYGDNNHKLYALLSSELAKIIPIEESTYFYIDRTSRDKKVIDDFNNLFKNNLNNPKNYPVFIKHVDSRKYKGIQIADVMSWSVYQYIENNNDDYIKLIKNRVEKRVFED